MRLDERKEHILDFIVREYIDTAQPVSSGRMASKKVLDSSPATLRNIMLELDEEGFLFQPHTSAGRAPTEKGYRYFIDYLINSSAPKPQENARRVKHGAGGLEELVADFAHELGVFASVMMPGSVRRELAGFSDILSEPEFRGGEMLENFGRMVDEIDSVMSDYRDALLEENGIYDIWIGRENIYPGAKKGSTIVARLGAPLEDEMIFFAYGSTRMDYEKAIRKINRLIENI